MPCWLGSIQELSSWAITGACRVIGIGRERECSWVKGSIGVRGGGEVTAVLGKGKHRFGGDSSGLLESLGEWVSQHLD